MNLGQLLKKIVDHIGIDWVTEEGTSGIWTYRKWKSGRKECWGRKVFTATIGSSWGALYINADDISDQYPFQFTNVPVCVAQLDANTNYSAFLYASTTSGVDRRNYTPKYRVARGTSASAQTYIISYYASADK